MIVTCLAVCAGVTRSTSTAVTIHRINTRCTIYTWTTRAFINVYKINECLNLMPNDYFKTVMQQGSAIRDCKHNCSRYMPVFLAKSKISSCIVNQSDLVYLAVTL